MSMLTKRQTEWVNAQKAIVEPPNGKAPLRYMVVMSLTEGELLALKNALDEYSSIVGEDVRAYLNNALEISKVNL